MSLLRIEAILSLLLRAWRDRKTKFRGFIKRFPKCNLFIWMQNLHLYLGFCFFRNCFYYPWSSTLQRLVRMSSTSCSGNAQTLVISALVESSRELSLAWENKVFLELTLPGLISRSSPPISMTCFFPLISLCRTGCWKPSFVTIFATHIFRSRNRFLNKPVKFCRISYFVATWHADPSR